MALPYIPTLLTQKQMDQKDDMAIVKAPQHVSILSWNVIHLGPPPRLHVMAMRQLWVLLHAATESRDLVEISRAFGGNSDAGAGAVTNAL